MATEVMSRPKRKAQIDAAVEQGVRDAAELVLRRARTKELVKAHNKILFDGFRKNDKIKKLNQEVKELKKKIEGLESKKEELENKKSRCSECSE
jgi:phage shock protein A